MSEPAAVRALDGLYVGLISGTSMDGVDAALVRLDGGGVALVHALCNPYPATLRQRLIEIADPNQAVYLQQLAELDVLVGRHFGDAAQQLLEVAGVSPAQVRAVGSHGQTVGHFPDGEAPNSLQLGDPNTIAERCGLTTVADFRRRDMAVGGQGAPLVPAFHQALLQHETETRVVVNIGGIANVTILRADQEQAAAFDTGPGNGLLDAWSEVQRGQPVDEGGRWSASGTVQEDLLQLFLSDPYLSLPPPKSTGREYFNRHWLHAALQRHGHTPSPQDVQATLCEFTARTVAAAISGHASDAVRVIVCGGGVHNQDLMSRLAGALAPRPVQSSAEFGIDPDWMEAMAFAWLAARRLAGQPGNLPSATGARRAVPLGAVYPSSQ